MTVPCCAACLHAISDPDRPVWYDGCLFHPAHLPAQTRLASILA